MKQILYSLLLLLSSSSCVGSKAPSHLTETEYYKLMYEQASASAATSANISWAAIGLIGAIFPIILGLQYLANNKYNATKLREFEAKITASERKVQGDVIQTLDTRFKENAQTIEELQSSISELSVDKFVLQGHIYSGFSLLLGEAVKGITAEKADARIFMRLSYFIDAHRDKIAIPEDEYLRLQSISIWAKMAPTRIRGPIPDFDLSRFGNLIKLLAVYKNSDGKRIYIQRNPNYSG